MKSILIYSNTRRNLDHVCNHGMAKYLPSCLETTSCSDLDSLRFSNEMNENDYKEETENCSNHYDCVSLRKQQLNIKGNVSLNVIFNRDILPKPMDYKNISSNSTPDIIDRYFDSNYTMDVLPKHRSYYEKFFYTNTNQIKYAVYRVEFRTDEISYCPACNSEAMFEVLKSLYECYKRRVCDNCNCILCGPFFREKRRSMLSKISKKLDKVSSRIKSVEVQIKQTEAAMVGKTPAEKEKLLKNLALTGAPLPEGKTASEKTLINKVRRNLGIPPAPITESEKEKMKKVAELGLLQPLEGKDAIQKEKILQNFADMNIPLPEGRTDSERALIEKVQATARVPADSLSVKLQKAKDSGILTPLSGKPPHQKKKMLRCLALAGLPMPEAKTSSDHKLIKEVRSEVGLPPEPKTSAMKEKYTKVAEIGCMQPLEGKSPQEKERILTRFNDMGIPLPTGRSPSEKSLIAKIKAESRPSSILAPSQKMRKAKAAGLITSLESKTPEQREKILNELANLGIPLPEGTTPSEKKLINKVRYNLGLPPEPKTQAMKEKHKKAADVGLLQPLEGKAPKEKERILRGLQDMGISLPEGRTPSEKALVTKIKSVPRSSLISAPSDKMRRDKTAGLITPLKGKTPEEKEKKLKELATLGIPLPEGTSSEKPLINKVRAEIGLPPEPKNQVMKDKHTKAANAGLLKPLEGKTPKEKEKILRGLNDVGIPLPEGRTSSEKALISKITGEPPAHIIPTPSDKIRMAKKAGLITPLDGKTTEQKEKILSGLASLGIPLPEGKTSSEKKLIDRVRTDLGLPPTPKTAAMKDKHIKAAMTGLLQPLEGKTPSEKERILKGLNEMGIPLPEARTPSEKALISKIKPGSYVPDVLSPSEKMRRAKVAGLITPLKDKTTEQREKILKGLATLGIPLPEGTTDSEKDLINKVRTNLGLPPEPKTQATRDVYEKAADAGILCPLEGKPVKEKERILRGLNDMGIPLPEGRTSSEKTLIKKIKSESHISILSPSEKMRRARIAGLSTPLKDKTPEQREKILKGLATLGIPLPQGTTDSEKKIIDKVRANQGLPPEPKNEAMRGKYAKAADAGFLQPLEGKPTKEKEKILRGLNDMAIPLPEGRTSSEKALINKIKTESYTPILSPSEKMRRAKAAGFITPLKDKTPEQKEKILKGLASLGIPLPQGTTDSEKNLINKIRTNLGLPPEPKTLSMKDKHIKAAERGALQPLQGKTPQEKERILRELNDMGIPLPEGRTPSEKALISKMKSELHTPSSSTLSPSEKMRRAKVAGLITPLKDKTPEQKETILKGLATLGIPLPQGTTDSEKKLINKVRVNLGLPPEPKTQAIRDKHANAADLGLLQPLEGKPTKEKERILRGLNNMDIPLPEGRTPSEKALINKLKSEPHTSQFLTAKKSPITKVKQEAESHAPTILAPSEKIRRAKAAGLITNLKDKTPEQRKKICKGLANLGIPLPEPTTASEKKLIRNLRKEIGLPPEPKYEDMRHKHTKAADAGLLLPLEGKTPREKERILRGLNNMGIPLPKSRTPSEKALITRIKAEPRAPLTPSEKMHRAKASTHLTPSQKVKGDRIEKKTEIYLPEKNEKSKATKPLTSLDGKPFISASSEKLRKGKTSGLPIALEGKKVEPKESEIPAIKEKYAKTTDADILQPIKDKYPKDKEKSLHGPAIVDQTKKDLSGADKTHEAKLRSPKATALLTPLENKSLEQKEKILKERVAARRPLPVGKTPSEKKIIDKIRADTGYITPSPTEIQKKVKPAGLISPLKGKSPIKKTKISKDLIGKGTSQPEKETSSDTELKKKVTPPKKTMSEKIKDAKAASLLTPLADKTPEQKEKILKGLVNIGLPLPEANTPSENKLIERVRAETGLPPEPKTPSMKEKYKKAHADGLITPLEGKSPKEKEAILNNLHDAGIPLPEGRTLSEKSITRKIKAKLKPIGISNTETKVCDHACGCDKKKIKFKHSFVRITVISPDLSSICDCPNECLPIISKTITPTKDGIKVTIGNVIEVPKSFSTEHTNSMPNLVTKRYNDIVQLISDCKSLSLDALKVTFNHMHKKDKLANKVSDVVRLKRSVSGNYLNCNHKTSSAHNNYTSASRKKSLHPYLFERYFERYIEYPKCFVTKNGIHKTQEPYCSFDNLSTQTSERSLTTILIVKSDTSLSMTASTGSFLVESFMSYTDDTNSALTQYSDTECYYSDTTVEYSGSVTNGYTTEDATESYSTLYIPKLTSIKRIEEEYNRHKRMSRGNFTCYQMSQTKPKKLIWRKQKTKVAHSAIGIKKVNNETDITTILNEPLMLMVS